MKQVIAFIAGALVGIVALYILGPVSDNRADIMQEELEEVVMDKQVPLAETNRQDIVASTDDRKESVISEEGMLQDTLLIATQDAGDTVMVSSVTIDTGAHGNWVVVHEIQGGRMANALGAVRLDAGVHADVQIKLLRATVAGGEYAVVLYADNGDRKFDMQTDAPIKNGEEYQMSTFNAI